MFTLRIRCRHSREQKLAAAPTQASVVHTHQLYTDGRGLMPSLRRRGVSHRTIYHARRTQRRLLTVPSSRRRRGLSHDLSGLRGWGRVRRSGARCHSSPSAGGPRYTPARQHRPPRQRHRARDVLRHGATIMVWYGSSLAVWPNRRGPPRVMLPADLALGRVLGQDLLLDLLRLSNQLQRPLQLRRAVPCGQGCEGGSSPLWPSRSG